MEQKTYGLDTLAFICAGSTSATDADAWVKAIHKALLPRHEDRRKRATYRVRDDGLYRNSKMRVAVGLSSCDSEVLHWQPVRGAKKPALPIPFTAGEFAAFTLAGLGTMVIERFEDDDDDEALNERALAELGRNGAEAREVLREAHNLRLEAKRLFGRNVAEPDEPPVMQLGDKTETDNAVAWLLNEAQREGLAIVGVGPEDAGPTPQPSGKKRWTDERKAELSDYREAHGTEAAAEKYNISGSRVRQLLPKKKAQPKGYSAFSSGRQ